MPECTTLTMHIFRYSFEDGSSLISLGNRQFRLYEGGRPVAFACRQSRDYRHLRRPRPLSPEDTARLIRLAREVEAMAAHWAIGPEARRARLNQSRAALLALPS